MTIAEFYRIEQLVIITRFAESRTKDEIVPSYLAIQCAKCDKTFKPDELIDTVIEHQKEHIKCST